MKQLIFLILFCFLAFPVFSEKKYLVESKTPMSCLNLINSKTNEITRITPWRNNKTGFEFEASDISEFALRVPLETKIRIYSFDDKVITNWHSIKKEESILVKKLFEQIEEVNVDITRYLLKTYEISPVILTSDNVRNADGFHFYTPDKYNFQKPENISISWTSGSKIVSLGIVNLQNDEIIYSTKNYSDTVLEFKDLPKDAQSKLKSYGTYIIDISVNSSYFMGRVKQFFYLNPVTFTEKQKFAKFISKDELYFSWNSENKPVNLKIYDVDRKVVYKKQTTENELKGEKVSKLESGKKYTIEIEQNGYSEQQDFVILLKNKERDKLGIK